MIRISFELPLYAVNLLDVQWYYWRIYFFCILVYRLFVWRALQHVRTPDCTQAVKSPSQMRVYATRNILYSRNRVQQIYGSISGRSRSFRVHMISATFLTVCLALSCLYEFLLSLDRFLWNLVWMFWHSVCLMKFCENRKVTLWEGEWRSCARRT